ARIRPISSDTANDCRQMDDDIRLDFTVQPSDGAGVAEVVVLRPWHDHVLTSPLPQLVNNVSAEETRATGHNHSPPEPSHSQASRLRSTTMVVSDGFMMRQRAAHRYRSTVGSMSHRHNIYEDIYAVGQRVSRTTARRGMARPGPSVPVSRLACGS